ncbi:MAG: ATP-binding protein [Actinomycetota bacterium]
MPTNLIEMEETSDPTQNASVARVPPAESSAARAEVLYRMLVEQIPAITYVEEFDEARDRDDDGRDLFMSPQSKTILGYPPEELVQDQELWWRLVHPQDRQRVRRAASASHSSERFSCEFRMITRDGRVVWVQEDAAVVRDPATGVQLWHGVILDITARKAAEIALAGALVREQAASERLRKIDEMKDGLLRAISHDLRTPLTTIYGGGKSLLSVDDFPDSTRRAILEGIVRGAGKMQRIVENLLDLDRIDKGQATVHELAPVRLDEVARRVADEVALDAVRVEVETEPLVVNADEAMLERIVDNLVVNAVKHTPDGTSVRLLVTSTNAGAELVVEDEGPGVPDRMKESIFAPFHRGPEHDRPGLGIGLSIVAHFAQMHGGRAWVTDRAGGGATFHVWLPVDDDFARQLAGPST